MSTEVTIADVIGCLNCLNPYSDVTQPRPPPPPSSLSLFPQPYIAHCTLAMGFCFSCCRRTVDEHDDREPLLPRYHDQSHIPYRSRDPLPPPRTSFDKLADIVAALHAGKLPSQEQVNRALRHALTSDLLNPESYGGLGHDHGARTKEQEELEETGRNVLHAIREASQALLEFGMEKNGESHTNAHGCANTVRCAALIEVITS